MNQANHSLALVVLSVIVGQLTVFSQARPSIDAWSAESVVGIPSIGSPPAEVREQHTQVRIGSSQTRVKRLWIPNGGAAWTGLDYPAYCVSESTIVGFRVVGWALLMRRGAAITPGAPDIEGLSQEFIGSMTPVVTDVRQDDFGIDLGAEFGTEATIGRNASAGDWAEIVNLTATQDDAVVELRTVAGRNLKISFDKELRPWRANVDGQDVLMMGLGTFNPRIGTRLPWSSPRPTKVKALTGAINANLRTSTGGGLLERPQGEIARSSALVVTVDGRLWLGPLRSEIAATDSGLVGFMVDDEGDLIATVCKEQIPMTRESVALFRDWIAKEEGAIRAGTNDRRRLVSLRNIDGVPDALKHDAIRYGTLRVNFSDNGVMVHITTTSGAFLVNLSPEFAVMASRYESLSPADGH